MGKKRISKKKVVKVCIGEKILVEHRCKIWITIKRMLISKKIN